MPQKPPNTAKPFAVQRPKRLRNTLVSVLICAGLMAAYYVSLSSTPIPVDTHIVYEARDCGGPCRVFRLDIAADGTVSLQDARHVWRYKISQFALRRILHTFEVAHFLTRDVNAYLPQNPPVCDLILTEDHRLLDLRHACGASAPELAGPVRALETATHYREVLTGKTSVLRDDHVQVRSRDKDGCEDF